MTPEQRASLRAGVLASAGPVACVAAMLYGAAARMGSGQKELRGEWFGEWFGGLAALGLLTLIGGALVVARSRDSRPGALLGPVLGGFALFGASLGVFALAWASGRQNYWEAIHFAALIWAWQGGAVIALIAAVAAGRRGIQAAQLLVGPAVLLVVVSAVGWAWTWSEWVQGLQGSIVRALWSATHG